MAKQILLPNGAFHQHAINSINSDKININSINSDIIEGGISCERPSGRPCQKTLDWMIDKVNWKMYGYIKEKAQMREKWRKLCTGPVFDQRT